jgi:hypothetical protein
MNWFQENRFLGTFLVVCSIGALGAVWFLFNAKSDWNDAEVDFTQAAAELNRLERLAPYPSSENLRQLKTHTSDYVARLTRLQDDLKKHVVPLPSLAPNEFQSHLRLAMTAAAAKARANNVRLPDRFCLGFDEFASALPSEPAAPLLGQELVQIEWLLDTLFAARVEAVTSFHRAPLPQEQGSSPRPVAPTSKTPGTMAVTGPRVIERNIVEATFVSTPAAARKVLNQIAAADQQFFVIRLLHVRNEKDKGPAREVVADVANVAGPAPSPAPADSPGAKPSPAAALNFIVGNERIETSAKIEIVRFTF